MDNLPKGDRPDWGRVMVSGPSQLAAAQYGDPVRWGATVLFTLPAAAPAGLNVMRSGQIISAQCRDPYSRGWTIAGNLKYAGVLLSQPNPAPNVPMVAGEWAGILSCTMGVGQTQVVHNYDLREIVAADRPFYRGSDNTISGIIGPLVGNTILEEAFIIPGAVVANMISIQVIIAIDLVAPPGVDLPFGCNVIVTPFAAGTNL